MNVLIRNTLLALVAAGAAGLAASCIPTEEAEVGALPDQRSFEEGKVSFFLERRCGALDCHGQVGRPLRLYGEYGLRLKPNADGTRPQEGTTQDELQANYAAVIGLEPEELARCYEAGKDLEDGEGCPSEAYSTLQLLKKPLGIEGNGIRHKGGPIVQESASDPGWQCLHGWASGHGYPDKCEQAAALQ